MPEWLSADEALAALRLKPQTLYAYVSRGLVGARADSADSRRSLYRAADIERLKQRKARGRKRGAIAEDAIRWGEPVLPSALTAIERGRLFYCGRDVETLAANGAKLEDVARLLWDCGEARFPPEPRVEGPGSSREKMFAALGRKAAHEPGLLGRATEALFFEAASVVDALANAACGGRSEGPVHQRMARAWGVGDAGAEAIRVALVCLADHELNPSTFAARVTASTGASLAACALAGLSALTGPLHGGSFARVRAFTDAASRLGERQAVLSELAARGAPPPGFDHPLYPEGDPRARALFAVGDVSAANKRLVETTYELTGKRPNVDFALNAVAASLSLPNDATFLMFAVARSVGWIAHALEQYRSGRLIRPRAHYVGPAPEAAT